jgi:urease subunit alpha
MVHNTRTGLVDVDVRTGAVRLDGERLESPPAQSVALSRLYFL